MHHPLRLRPKARTLAPERFDPGQLVDHDGHRGVIWALGPEASRNSDARWVSCEDGTVRLLSLHKRRPAIGKGSVLVADGWRSGYEYVPSNPRPFTLGDWTPIELDAPLPDPVPEPVVVVKAAPAPAPAPAPAEPATEPEPVPAEPATEPAVPTRAARCDTCRGFGLVRRYGANAGRHYRTLNGAVAALRSGNTALCPACAARVGVAA